MLATIDREQDDVFDLKTLEVNSYMGQQVICHGCLDYEHEHRLLKPQLK